MKKNKNVVLIEKDTEIAKGFILEAGDALVRNGKSWTLIEADGEDEKEDMKEEDEGSEEDKKEDEKKKEESKKK